MKRYGHILSAVAIAAILNGCATYQTGYRYRPNPASVTVTGGPATEANAVHVLGTVVGVRTEWAKLHPDTVEIRLLVDNNAPAPVVLAPGELVLRSADLNAFAPPTTDPAEPITVPPGAQEAVTAYFPLGGEDVDYDLDGLTLRVPLRIGNETVARTITFDRRNVRVYRYRDPFYDPWYGPYHYGYPYGFHSRLGLHSRYWW